MRTPQALSGCLHSGWSTPVSNCDLGMWNLCYCLGSYKREFEGSEACLWAYTCSVEIHILTRKYVDPCTFQKLENYCV